MATGYSIETTGVLDGTLNPPAKLDGRLVGGRVRCRRATIDLSTVTAKNSGDTIVLTRIPAGERVIAGLLTVSATLGTSTVAIGKAGATGKYRAAAVQTVTDTPTPFGVATTLDDAPLAAYEDVIMTIGVANLPGAGIIVVDLLTSGR